MGGGGELDDRVEGAGQDLVHDVLLGTGRRAQGGLQQRVQVVHLRTDDTRARRRRNALTSGKDLRPREGQRREGAEGARGGMDRPGSGQRRGGGEGGRGREELFCQSDQRSTPLRREGRDRRGGPEAVRQAVGGGCQSSWGRLLSVTNAIEAGPWRRGDSSRAYSWAELVAEVVAVETNGWPLENEWPRGH